MNKEPAMQEAYQMGKISADIDHDKKEKKQNSMKRLTAILLSALLILSLAACGNNNQNTGVDTPAGTESPATKPADNENSTGPAESETADTENSDTAETGNGNILIAYFSVMETDGVDTVAGASRVAVNGEVLDNMK